MPNLRWIALIALLSVLAACGDSDPDETKSSPKRSGGQDDVEIRVTDRGENKPGSSGELPERSEEAALSLAVTVEKKTYDAGEPIEATFVLRNSGPKDILMYQPARTLGGDYRLEIVNPRGRKSVIRHRLRVREEQIEKDELSVLRPGEKVRTTVDLGAVLKETCGGVLGEYKITTVFTGGYQGKRHSMDIWNREGSKTVPAREMTITLTWPEDLKNKGVTQELDIQVSMILGDTKPNGELREAATKLLKMMGTKIYPTILHKLEQAESPRHPHQVIGWNAFAFLRDGGESALSAVLADKSERPLNRMLEAWMHSNQRKALGHPPLGEEAVFLDEVGKPENRVKMIFRLTRSANAGRTTETITLNGHGLLSRELYENGRATSKSRKLTDEEKSAFFLLVVNEKFWLQRAVRQHGSVNEGLITLEQLREAKEKPALIRRIEVWETEAKLFNHSLGRIIAAMQTLALNLVEKE